MRAVDGKQNLTVVVSDIQTRAEKNDLKNGSSYEFIGEVIFKINVV